MTNNENIFHILFYQLYLFLESVFMSFAILIRLFVFFFKLFLIFPYILPSSPVFDM